MLLLLRFARRNVTPNTFNHAADENLWVSIGFIISCKRVLMAFDPLWSCGDGVERWEKGVTSSSRLLERNFFFFFVKKEQEDKNNNQIA